ncbi:hypothetical protein RHODOSMS8_02450 [Rhodobiaceae bacterium]|nr:hypothetical protein RHODOSMS8_02450 [Rhodobiaceae bacterium]
MPKPIKDTATKALRTHLIGMAMIVLGPVSCVGGIALFPPQGMNDKSWVSAFPIFICLLLIFGGLIMVVTSNIRAARTAARAVDNVADQAQ